jgi:hypothetical protein
MKQIGEHISVQAEWVILTKSYCLSIVLFFPTFPFILLRLNPRVVTLSNHLSRKIDLYTPFSLSERV